MAAEITYSRGKGWRRDGRAWIGLFRGARAHRLPPGVRWEEVSTRKTRDISTGEIVEDHDAAKAPFAPAQAGRKLDRVRDIETVVELLCATGRAERSGASVPEKYEATGHFRDERFAPQNAPPRKSWADMISDEELVI